MLTEICAELRNYFCSEKDINRGKFTIINGDISPSDFLQVGQFYRITGSVFNDGVWQYPSDRLIDETFDGAVWAMAVPPAVVALAEEIQEYEKSEANKPTNYISESFGGYSYTKATDAHGNAAGWQTVFASRLNKWRKIHI